MTRDDGMYQGEIIAAYIVEDQWDEGEHALKLDVDLTGGGAVTCRQSLADKKEVRDKRNSVLRALGLSVPIRSTDLAELKGRTVDVNLKTSPKGRQNAYIATAREERVLSPEQVDAIADGDESPF